MKILHVSTFERAGGAAIAAYRLHQGLLQLGHDSRMLVRDASGEADGRVVCVDGASASVSDALLEKLFYAAYHRASGESGRLFSIDAPFRDFLSLPAVREADIINVHWASGFLSTAALRTLQDAGKPIVWTLHDQNAFTGGCHYSGGCEQFTAGCAACPHLDQAIAPIAAITLEQKRRWLDSSRLHVVTPSHWLADCARRSSLLGSADIRTIANAVPVAALQSISRQDARRRLVLPEDATILLIGADRMDEPRKGYAHLEDALRRLGADPEIRRQLAARSLVCAAFGEGALFEGAIPVLRLGRLDGDAELAAAYRAADLFVLPTLEDNLPNTMLESIAAGVPVVAYATGGLVDVLGDGNCGVTIPTGDIEGLSGAIRDLVLDNPRRQQMSDRCLTVAGARFDLPVQAEAYVSLYRELWRGRATAAAVVSHREIGSAVEVSDADAWARIQADSTLSRALMGTLSDELGSQRQLIDSRGGEIDALRKRVLELENAAAKAATASSLPSVSSGAEPSAPAQPVNPFAWLLAAHTSTPTARSAFAHEPVAGRVSVVIPVFNTVRYLEHTVRSVWGQTLAADRIEIVVVDDGSSDGSYELALRLQAQSPVTMSVLTHHDRANRGVSATRNHAIAHATGEFIALLDADDVYLPTRLARGLEHMTAHPECGAVCSLGDNVDQDGTVMVGANGTSVAGDYRSLSPKLQPPFTFDQLWDTYPVANSSLLMRRTAMQYAGGYAAEMAHQAEDLLLVLKLSLQSPIHCLDEKLIQYRHHGASYTTQYHAHAFEAGVRLEVLYFLVHWMVVQRPEHRERGLALFRRNYPLLLSRSHAGRRAVDALVAMAASETGIDAQAFLAARQREVAELDALRTVVPTALREARDAREEVIRLRAEIAGLRGLDRRLTAV
jgi:glycosyltransferase involved in cell wall biosynthesis/GT2 family glycosyltransferase